MFGGTDVGYSWMSLLVFLVSPLSITVGRGACKGHGSERSVWL